MPSVRKTFLWIALLMGALFTTFLFSPEATAPPTEREPAFRDNFYGLEIRGDLIWIVGYYGTILHSRDRGLTWQIQSSGTREALYRVVFFDDQRGWISGSYGTILHTQDGGGHWQIQPTPTEEHLLGLQFIDEQTGWAVGSRAALLHTGDGGSSWVNRPLGEDIILNDVQFLDHKHGWIVGEFGRIYRTTDGGQTWLKQQSPIEVSFVSGESRNLFRLLFSNSNGGLAFGLDGVILASQKGERWQVAAGDGATPPRAKRNHLFSASRFDGRKWAVGERGTILAAGLEDHQWEPAGLRIPPVSLNGIAFGQDGLGLIVGNRGLILRTGDGGREWKQYRIVTEAPGRGVSKAS